MTQTLEATHEAGHPSTRMPRTIKLPRFSAGFWSALPLSALLLFGFLAPLALVVIYSFMPRGSFSPIGVPTLENYVDIITQSFYISFLWSFLLAVLSTLILLVVAWPLAKAVVRASPARAVLITMLIVAPLFVAENIRLQGWVLFFDRAGVLDGGLNALFGVGTGSLTNNVPIIVFGLVYIYLPFMLFPMILGLSNVPADAREAAADLGASRWRVFRDVELPLAAPGISIGALLCFVISLGAFSEAKFLGKGVIVTIAQDIESAFTFGQNWPRGSALSVLVIMIAGAAVWMALRRIDLDKMLARR